MAKEKNFIDKIMDEGTLGVLEHKVSPTSILGLGAAALAAGILIALFSKYVLKSK